MRAAILLAAGGSRRFGRGDKLMTRIGARPLVEQALARALASDAQRVIVIVPSLGGRVGRQVAAIRRMRLRIVVAKHHRDGLAASLHAGIAALRPVEREVLIFLGDMPFAAAPKGMRIPPAHDAIRPFFKGRPGHPLLVRSAVARRWQGDGDQGLAATLDRRRVASRRGSSANLIDIDTPAALRRARARLTGAATIAADSLSPRSASGKRGRGCFRT